MIYAVTILFIALAAACKAVADTLKDHFSSSVFRWRDQRFWNPAVSWRYVGYIKFTKYHPDAWHIANSLMIIFFDAAIVSITTMLFNWSWYWFAAEFIAIGICFNLVFNLFYSLLSKPKK